MRITIDVDCTAIEARRFLGLPDLTPLHDAMVAELSERLRGGMGSMDAETLMRQWMPMGGPAMEQMQKTFWSVMAGAASRKAEDDQA